MIKTLKTLLLCSALSGCQLASSAIGAFQADQTGSANQPQGQVTRASVEASGLSVMRAAPSVENLKFNSSHYYIAMTNNNNAIGYGKDGKDFVTLRGGLVVSQYFLGNDLLNIAQNAQDPVQFQRPYTEWPQSYQRSYELPGNGLSGEKINVTCTHQPSGSGDITILEQTHSTALIIEKCTGDTEIENSYMLDASGFIWRSEQWAGHNPYPLYIDIVEPLT